MPTPLERAKFAAWTEQHDTILTWMILCRTNPEMPLLAAVRLAKQLVRSSEEFDAKIDDIGRRNLRPPVHVPVCQYCGKATCSLANRNNAILIQI